ncbi:threonine--tRNA ligase, cytoplasmic-like [Cotesia glomerata]|uniref:threonine--tRNA ligase, cytoplasmic-like n=1 Tax=Cotesia glomerata TaxID=32391 RepID=UPI001D006966|nr:threonine--tRNA ligase, cytoplasmic-like [Cotesia glomerata]
MTKEDFLKMFEYNEFKVRILKEKVQTPTTTVYKCGPLIDLFRGPHQTHGYARGIVPRCDASSIRDSNGIPWWTNANADDASTLQMNTSS